MSYYEDWIAPYLYDIEAEERRVEEIYENRHIGWTTAKGELIPYSKMTTRHLINCKRMVERDNFRKDFLPYLNTELRRRGVI